VLFDPIPIDIAPTKLGLVHRVAMRENYVSRRRVSTVTPPLVGKSRRFSVRLLVLVRSDSVGSTSVDAVEIRPGRQH